MRKYRPGVMITEDSPPYAAAVNPLTMAIFGHRKVRRCQRRARILRRGDIQTKDNANRAARLRLPITGYTPAVRDNPECSKFLEMRPTCTHFLEIDTIAY